MKCAREKIMEFLDGELDSREKEKVEEHLEKCQSCSQYAKETNRAIQLLHSLPIQKAPITLKQNLQQEMKTLYSPNHPREIYKRKSPVGSSESHLKTTSKISLISFLRPFFTAAAVVLIFLSGWFFAKLSKSPTSSERSIAKKSRSKKLAPKKSTRRSRRYMKKELMGTSEKKYSDQDKNPQENNIKNKIKGQKEELEIPKAPILKTKQKKSSSASPPPNKPLKNNLSNRAEGLGKNAIPSTAQGDANKSAKKSDSNQSSGGGSGKYKEDRGTGQRGGRVDKKAASVAKDLEKSKKINQKEKMRKAAKLTPHTSLPSSRNYMRKSIALARLKSQSQIPSEILLLSGNLQKARGELLTRLPKGAILQGIYFGLNESQILQTRQNKRKWPFQCILIEVKVPLSRLSAYLLEIEKMPSIRYFPGTSPRYSFLIEKQESKKLLSISQKKGSVPPARPSRRSSQFFKKNKAKSPFLKIWVYASSNGR